MAASKGRQFILLLWKNFLIQKRKKFVTCLEILLPVFFAILLIVIRQITSATYHNEITTWNHCDVDHLPRSLPKKFTYTPQNDVTDKIMSDVQHKLGFTKVIGFKNENNMVDFLLMSNNTESFLGGVTFEDSFQNNGQDFKNNIRFKIRLSSEPRNEGDKKKVNPFSQTDNRWPTKFNFPLFQRVGPREQDEHCGGKPGYEREGFLAIQQAVSIAIIQDLGTNDSVSDLNETYFSLRRHPYPPYNDDNFVLVIQQQFPLVLMLSFVVIALSIVKDVVYEKERKLKESMKMMGLSGWLHWLAWFVKYLIFALITVGLMTLFFCLKLNLDIGKGSGSVVGNTEPTVLFIFLLVYSISSISFCFLISVFFSKANSGAAAGGILFFVSYIPYFFLTSRYQNMSWTAKIAACLDFNTAMALGGQVIGMFEGTGTGVQWSNIADGASVDDDFTLLNVLVMLLVDSVLYGIVTWYIEAVFPGDYGVPQRWYFPVTASYWCGNQLTEASVDDKSLSIGQIPEFFENDPVGIKPGIQIRNLRKVFGKDEKKNVAVAGMTLDMYEGQITALLGHNGAGKTTTMSMLTGFMPSSSGTALVNGYDIRTDISNVRSSLGLCPQHDILFDNLTVEEHMVFFAKLKGVDSVNVKQEVDDMLKSVGLEPKRKSLSGELSGGMKRKLSVGIALIGGSKIVILDEPSSGMDPDARRSIWSVLQKNRAGRTIILTTHFMDEADLLGDRIAIMADGVIKCCGSSLFLKKKYGAGYHMVVVKQAKCNVSKLTEVVKRFVPTATIESNVGAELSYILPQESSSSFEALFTELQEKMNELAISSFGASVTTMEEVFLKVGEGSSNMDRLQAKSTAAAAASSNSNTFSDSGVIIDLTTNGSLNNRQHLDFGIKVQKNTGIRLYLQQFSAMFLKRVLHTVRNKKVAVAQLGLPLFFTIVTLIVLKTFPGPTDAPALTLNIEEFGRNFLPFSTSQGDHEYVDDIATFYGNSLNKSENVLTYINRLKEYQNNSDIVKYLADRAKEGIGNYNLRYIIAAEFSEDNTLGNITSFFNNQAYHSPAVTLASMMNSVLKWATNSSKHSLTVVNHPLPRTDLNKIDEQANQNLAGFQLAFNILFGMSFLSSSFILFLIKERSVKAKHVQFVSGVHAVNFWIATFCWDLINYLIPCILLLITFAGFDTKPYIVDGHWLDIFFLFLMYGWAMLPLMYLMSFLFKVPATGYVWVTMINILSGVACVMVVAILEIPQLDLLDVSLTLEWIFLVIIPHFCLGQGLEDYYNNYEMLTQCKPLQTFCKIAPEFPNPCCKPVTGYCGANTTCLDINDNYLGWEANGIGRMLVFLFLQGIVYFGGLFLIESKIVQTILYKFKKGNGRERPTYLRQMSNNEHLVQEDSDVATERARIANSSFSTSNQSDVLLLNEITKYYGNHLAVDHISVGIPQGECFGLLGVNGAGKTTTFKMLTGDEEVSAGNAFLEGFSVKSDIHDIQQRLGYCPQFDALIDQLTGRETLMLFARLRGVQEFQIKPMVKNVLEALLLNDHADKLTMAYSGGNKRKLSTAIALIGSPPIIFLDEPTTGMDPVARRLLWDTLVDVRDSGRTLVLTSHSMEECEALCTRLAIMVNGEFKCLGSPQHLKNKFGEGYTVLAKIAFPSSGQQPDPEPLMSYIEQQFPGSVLKDVHQCLIHYHITDTNFTWGQVFGVMEKAKEKYNIEDYSVSQTTLDQVFINFARAQLPPKIVHTSCLKSCFSCFNGSQVEHNQFEYERHHDNV
ncbi:hypothetical protein LOTGIDRAFT_229502 [Lottia gigantea]|uniref:ABC transporter domain-containing protein n=1 Tax=Lottia gigantea TaxID=225164 RepID=V3Z0D6_LOTGI|nr:hypothetical protein LOTGIDRAFT_229502 [Lottia gigantea]ESO83918.1 hypothetical protein LOTGIDRAFT_229502 [Lottia gigantea]